MKDYKKILSELDGKDFILIEHEWGQNSASIYNQIVSAWNKLPVQAKIFVLSRKKYGFKSIVSFLREQGLSVDVVGKGAEDIRMIEIIKDSQADLQKKDSPHRVDFVFHEKNYSVTVGNAVFSKTGLDEGTRFLLETALAVTQNFSDTVIGDLGAGWGAISLIMATEFPTAKIIACEKEVGALEALTENVKNLKNVEVLSTDLTKSDTKREKHNRTLDFIITNFSFHITEEERRAFFETAHKLLQPRGEVFFVTEGRFVEWFEKTALEFFEIVDSFEYKWYKVFRCKK